jgi:hypothetical protein
VPPLPGYGPLSGALLAADAVEVASLGAAALFPQWGIYLNGAPVIQPASFVSSIASSVAPLIAPLANALGLSFPIFASFIDFEFKQDWPIADYQVEQGGFQSYDKVQLPFDIPIRIASGGTASERQQFIDACDAIANSLSLFDIVTPEGAYSSCSVTHMEFRRTAENGVSLIVVELFFKEIRVTSTATYQNTQTPVVAGPQALGNVTPAAPSAALSGVPLLAN